MAMNEIIMKRKEDGKEICYGRMMEVHRVHSSTRQADFQKTYRQIPTAKTRETRHVLFQPACWVRCLLFSDPAADDSSKNTDHCILAQADPC